MTCQQITNKNRCDWKYKGNKVIYAGKTLSKLCPISCNSVPECEE